MTTQALVILFIVGFGLIAGFFVARASEEREAIEGGQVARLLNYLASCVLISITPSALLSLIVLEVPLLQVILLITSMIVLGVLLLMPFAALEKPARAAAEKARQNQGWTQADAEASGL